MPRCLRPIVAALFAGLAGAAVPAVAQAPVCGGTVVCANPLGATISHPSSARQCSEIEVVIDSPEGHEWIYAQTSPGLGALRTWTERCGWGAGPCVSDAGGGTSSDWNPSIGYRGRLHVRPGAHGRGAAALREPRLHALHLRRRLRHGLVREEAVASLRPCSASTRWEAGRRSSSRS